MPKNLGVLGSFPSKLIVPLSLWRHRSTTLNPSRPHSSPITHVKDFAEPFQTPTACLVLPAPSYWVAVWFFVVLGMDTDRVLQISTAVTRGPPSTHASSSRYDGQPPRSAEKVAEDAQGSVPTLLLQIHGCFSNKFLPSMAAICCHADVHE